MINMQVASIAQLVERGFSKAEVQSSNLCGGNLLVPSSLLNIVEDLYFPCQAQYFVRIKYSEPPVVTSPKYHSFSGGTTKWLMNVWNWQSRNCQIPPSQVGLLSTVVYIYMLINNVLLSNNRARLDADTTISRPEIWCMNMLELTRIAVANLQLHFLNISTYALTAVV